MCNLACRAKFFSQKRISRMKRAQNLFSLNTCQNKITEFYTLSVNDIVFALRNQTRREDGSNKTVQPSAKTLVVYASLLSKQELFVNLLH